MDLKDFLVLMLLLTFLLCALCGNRDNEHAIGTRYYKGPNLHISMLNALADVAEEQRRNGTYDPRENLDTMRIISKDYIDSKKQ